jgi:hypothetical protein
VRPGRVSSWRCPDGVAYLAGRGVAAAARCQRAYATQLRWSANLILALESIIEASVEWSFRPGNLHKCSWAVTYAASEPGGWRCDRRTEREPGDEGDPHAGDSAALARRRPANPPS